MLGDCEGSADVRESIRRIRRSPFLPHADARGFVFDVATGKLNEVHLKERVPA